MKLINLTPHDVNIHARAHGSGETRVYRVPASGTVARLEEFASARPSIRIEEEGGVYGVKIPISGSSYGEVKDLPEPQEDVIFITSALVAQHVRRPDVMSPGALIRDQDGQPVGCSGLRAWAPVG